MKKLFELFKKPLSVAGAGAGARVGGDAAGEIVISEPFSCSHDMHVSHNSTLNTFEGMPATWQRWLEQAISIEQRNMNPLAVRQAIDFLQENYSPEGVPMQPVDKFLVADPEAAANMRIPMPLPIQTSQISESESNSVHPNCSLQRQQQQPPLSDGEQFECKSETDNDLVSVTASASSPLNHSVSVHVCDTASLSASDSVAELSSKASRKCASFQEETLTLPDQEQLTLDLPVDGQSRVYAHASSDGKQETATCTCTFCICKFQCPCRSNYTATASDNKLPSDQSKQENEYATTTSTQGSASGVGVGLNSEVKENADVSTSIVKFNLIFFLGTCTI